MRAANGGSAWVGDYHTMVIDAAGNVFKGPNASATFGLVNGEMQVLGWRGLGAAF